MAFLLMGLFSYLPQKVSAFVHNLTYANWTPTDIASVSVAPHLTQTRRWTYSDKIQREVVINFFHKQHVFTQLGIPEQGTRNLDPTVIGRTVRAFKAGRMLLLHRKEGRGVHAPQHAHHFQRSELKKSGGNENYKKKNAMELPRLPALSVHMLSMP